MSEKAFTPDPHLAAQIATNRAGKLTRSQKATIGIAALVCVIGLVVIAALFINVLTAYFGGVPLGSVISLIFLIFFVLSFGYLGLTLFFNARGFLPDALSRHPVRQARGKLEIKLAARERPELPFSYIVGEYSFAPFVVPYDVPMEAGREYVVYYAAHSRIFLNIEPVNSMTNDLLKK